MPAMVTCQRNWALSDAVSIRFGGFCPEMPLRGRSKFLVVSPIATGSFFSRRDAREDSVLSAVIPPVRNNGIKKSKTTLPAPGRSKHLIMVRFTFRDAQDESLIAPVCTSDNLQLPLITPFQNRVMYEAGNNLFRHLRGIYFLLEKQI
jgi:hypothetical protein